MCRAVERSAARFRRRDGAGRTYAYRSQYGPGVKMGARSRWSLVVAALVVMVVDALLAAASCNRTRRAVVSSRFNEAAQTTKHKPA
jgi:hypothetical protein